LLSGPRECTKRVAGDASNRVFRSRRRSTLFAPVVWI